ncbi:MAG: primosomal protein N' [Alphaproteobacteria bacterium]|nr:primosomal protein N' [Alphaproteobacteria bacterium]
MEVRLPVLLPYRLAHPYDYVATPDASLCPGDYVRVPLGRREAIGVVWDEGKPPPHNAGIRLKAIVEAMPAPRMPEVLRRFVEWVAAYTMTPMGLVLRMTMNIPEALVAPKLAEGLRLSQESLAGPEGLSPKRKQLVDFLVDSGNAPRMKAALARASGVTPAVIEGARKAGLLETVALPPPPFVQPDTERQAPELSPPQQSAADALKLAITEGGFQPSLLDGVTGSGKTEVYFEAIAHALRLGRQVLVLLPEIALGIQWLMRFEERFGTRPAVWHSELGRAERRRNWRAVAEGEARIVVGARSALFLPFPELGLIVVDEEHDASYKQEEGVIYQARDMAIVRAKLGEFPIVLASATPSLETMRNAEGGRYAHLHLPDRHAGADLPTVRLIDLRKDPPPRGRWLSPTLRAALEQTLKAGEQTMLFLNRRGYAPLTLCRNCGHRFRCPACTAWLVEHRQAGHLLCHHCGFSEPEPAACPACGAEGRLVPCGPGVERLAEEARADFPEARIAIMTSDTIGTAGAAADLVHRMQAGEIDLLVGTQVMAKGYHFPKLTLVGVVDADLGLAGGDLRAGERCYQMLHQVAGRAGREAQPGTAYLQTYLPETPVMQALAQGRRDAFLEAEARSREAEAMPPFGRLAALIVSGVDETAVARYAQRLRQTAPEEKAARVLGPAPAPLAMLRGKHRVRLLVKTGPDTLLQKTLHGWLEASPPPNGVKLQVDIDPYSFL